MISYFSCADVEVCGITLQGVLAKLIEPTAHRQQGQQWKDNKEADKFIQCFLGYRRKHTSGEKALVWLNI